MPVDTQPTFPTNPVNPQSSPLAGGLIDGQSVGGGGAYVAAGRTNPLTTRSQPNLGSPPNVVGLTNFGGAGAGAYIASIGGDADQSDGIVRIIVGPGQSGTPTLTLRFPAGIATNQYVFLCDWATVSPGVPAGGQIVLTFTPTRTLNPNEVLLLAYMWAVSI